LLRPQHVQFSLLNATCVFFRHQNILRKVLRQRSPGLMRYNSEYSLSENENGDDDSPKSESNDHNPNLNQNRDTELLIQSILVRAT
jgi:E3 ubiquitin-protein ligase HERC2